MLVVVVVAAVGVVVAVGARTLFVVVALLRLFSGKLCVSVFLGDKVDGACYDNEERVERKLVVGVDLIQLIHQEEDQGAAVSSRSVELRRNIDVDFGNLGDLDLLLDLG